MAAMPLFVVRLWVPDRPGALGAVASRIGAVRADVIGIDILERGAGRAIDELTVEVADPQLVDLLVTEISQVDGVDVEHVRPVSGDRHDRATESVALARRIAVAEGAAVLEELVAGLRHLVDADWVAVVDPAEGRSVCLVGGADLPSGEWLAAFVIGSAAGEGAFAAIDELTRVSLPSSSLELVVSRADLPLRDQERAVVGELAGLADDRLALARHA